MCFMWKKFTCKVMVVFMEPFLQGVWYFLPETFLLKINTCFHVHVCTSLFVDQSPPKMWNGGGPSSPPHPHPTPPKGVLLGLSWGSIFTPHQNAHFGSAEKKFPHTSWLFHMAILCKLCGAFPPIMKANCEHTQKS